MFLIPHGRKLGHHPHVLFLTVSATKGVKTFPVPRFLKKKAYWLLCRSRPRLDQPSVTREADMAPKWGWEWCGKGKTRFPIQRKPFLINPEAFSLLWTMSQKLTFTKYLLGAKHFTPLSFSAQWGTHYRAHWWVIKLRHRGGDVTRARVSQW